MDSGHGHSQACGRCPLHVGRRGFLAAAGGSAAALKAGVLDFASSLLGAEAKPSESAKPAKPGAKPVVHVVFFRPDTERYWMGWPGAAYNIKARQVEYTKTLSQAAKELGLQLEVHAKPLVNTKAVDAFLAQTKKSPPQGILAVVMSLNQGWRGADYLAAKKGDVPTVIFSPMGTSFTGHLQRTRKAEKTFVAATQDVSWLTVGLRMLWTVWAMKQSRLLICRGKATVDRPLDVIGTTLHYVPRDRFLQQFNETKDSEEVKALAAHWQKVAKKVVEPKPKDVVNAARTYFAARALMKADKCDGISVDCLGLIGGRKMPCGPCMAWLKLNDEGAVGACEADWNAAISIRLTALLCQRPGFMQDPAPNTVNNTLMGAHCACPTKLAGFDQPPAPLILRSHSESDVGCSPQVLWREGQKVTVMKFQGPGSIILGTGRVVANIDTPPSGGCRTSVEFEMDGIADTRDTKGFHQLFIYGDLEKRFRAYCQLAGIKVTHI